jgi:Tol biopolymer transport system component
VLVQAAAWSHDGRAILFTRTSTRTSNDGCVCLINADGTNRRNLGRGFPAGWSPDGSRILYTQAFYSPLFMMNRDGSHEHRVMNLAVSDPDWR